MMMLTTIAGLVLGFLLIIFSIIGKGNFALILPFINIPSVLIVFGCSIAALLVNHTFGNVFSGLAGIRYAFRRKLPSADETIDALVKMAIKARKEGFMGLRTEVGGKDPFLDLGVELMADGTAPDVILEILESKAASQAEVITKKERIWRDLSVYCPMFGMIGTLIGLVLMLRGLTDPSTIGPSMAIALITTFYGILIAGLVCIPIAGKIHHYSEALALIRQLIMTGILSIQSGNNSKIVEEKLKAQVPELKAPKAAGKTPA